jgi:CobQ-like glutamine amidotransferase family enzyme
VIAHLFPDLLRVYGDVGNVRTLARRAADRGINAEIVDVPAGSRRLPATNLMIIGGGQDREQVTVARELERLGGQLSDLVASGTTLLAVCGGYQNLGRSYRTAVDGDLYTPGILKVRTDATRRRTRIVGPVVGEASREIAALTRVGRWAPANERRAVTIVGFENHGGRTWLEPGSRPLATVPVGSGNNGRDRTEGFLALPGADGMAGLRIGTYLHGPLLPRNPHLADLLLLAATGHADLIAEVGLVSGGAAVGAFGAELPPLDDRLDWEAHDAAVRIGLERERSCHRPLHRILAPVRGLIGF